MHVGDRLRILVAGDDGGNAPLPAIQVLLGGGDELLVRETLDPLRGLLQPLGKRSRCTPSQQPGGFFGIGIPVRKIPGTAFHSAELRLLGDAELPPHLPGKFRNRSLATAADVEDLAVERWIHVRGRQDECAAGILHIDKIPRRAGIDKRGQRAAQRTLQNIRNQTRSVLERTVDGIEPQVDAGEPAMLAHVSEEVGGRHLGDGVVTVGLAGLLLGRPAGIGSVFRGTSGMHIGRDPHLGAELDEIDQGLKIGLVDLRGIVLEGVGPVGHTVQNRLGAGVHHHVLGGHRIRQVDGDDPVIGDILQPPRFLMLHDGKDIGTHRRNHAVEIRPDEPRGPEHKDWSTQIPNGCLCLAHPIRLFRKRLPLRGRSRRPCRSAAAGNPVIHTHRRDACGRTDG